MSLTKTLSFSGEKIKNPIYIVLAFGDVKDTDNYETVAWQVVYLGKGDTMEVSVVYSPQFAVAPIELKDGKVQAGGVIQPVKLGQSADLTGEGIELEWNNIQSISDKSKVLVYNKTKKAHRIALLLEDSPSLGGYKPIKTSKIMAANTGFADITFLPVLKAYAADKTSPGQIKIDIKQRIDWGRDLTKLGDDTHWIIRESEEHEYSIGAV